MAFMFVVPLVFVVLVILGLYYLLSGRGAKELQLVMRRVMLSGY